MKTVGYGLIMLGVMILSLALRGRKIENLIPDLRDASVAIATGDMGTVGEVATRSDPQVDFQAAYDVAKTAIESRSAVSADALNPLIANAGSSSGTIPGAGPGGKTVAQLVETGKWLQSQGFRTAENKALGDNPRPGVHMARGYHYKFDNSGAIDVNWPDSAKEPAKMDELAPKLRAAGYHVLWRVKGHYNHLHVDISRRDI